MPIYDYNGGMLKVTTNKENEMNNDNINDCISDLTDNFDLDTLLDYASDDDGAYTAQDHGADWPIVTIEAALARIANQK